MKMDAEFMQWQFKIAPCTKTYDHEWSTCPYVHEGEKMRRRDPRTHTCHACPLSKQKKPCPLGDVCQHAHNVYECGFHPDRFRTKYCRSGASCRRWNCFFAHSVEELRDPHTSSVGPSVTLTLAPTITPALAPADDPHSRSDSLDAFHFGLLDAPALSAPLGLAAAGVPTSAAAASLLMGADSMGSYPSASSCLSAHGLGAPASALMLDVNASGADNSGSFLGLGGAEGSLGLLGSMPGNVSPGGSSCGINSGSLLHSSDALLQQQPFGAGCAVTLAPPALGAAGAYDQLLPVEQSAQWLQPQQQRVPNAAAAQWLHPSASWQQLQQQQALWAQQRMVQQQPTALDTAALRQLMPAAGPKQDSMVHAMAMALGMDLQDLLQRN